MLGIITEYNPFHSGHKIHIEKSKEKTNSKNCIVVMSGNFTQRGEPAIFDKYIRTKMALLNGADIVLELPLCFATASAELFSLGAVDILNKTGIVKNICFGSEEGNIDNFLEVANILSNEPTLFKKNLNKFLDEGLSFPKARLKSLELFLDKNLSFLKEPNNILSIEYLKAINRLNSKILVDTIKREKTSFHSNEIYEDLASATAIRNALLNGNYKNIENVVPNNCISIIKNNIKNIHKIDDYIDILKYILKIKNVEEIKNISDITEGIENKIIENIDSKTITELISRTKSKRYTYTKLQRAILHIILDIKKDDIYHLTRNLNPYIRVLGFRKSSSSILKDLMENSHVPVITNLKNASKILDKIGLYFLEKEILSTDIYYISENRKNNMEYKIPLVIL